MSSRFLCENCNKQKPLDMKNTVHGMSFCDDCLRKQERMTQEKPDLNFLASGDATLEDFETAALRYREILEGEGFQASLTPLNRKNTAMEDKLMLGLMIFSAHVNNRDMNKDIGKAIYLTIIKLDDDWREFQTMKNGVPSKTNIGQFEIEPKPDLTIVDYVKIKSVSAQSA